MEVVTDAVPSQPRENQAPGTNTREQPKVQGQGVSAAPCSSKESEPHPVNCESVLMSPKPISNDRPSFTNGAKPKTSQRKKTSFMPKTYPKVHGAVIISNSSGVHVGEQNTYNLNFYQTSQNDKDAYNRTCIEMSEKNRKQLSALQNLKNPVEMKDLIIVSEYLTMKGLRKLVKYLGIPESVVTKYEDVYNEKSRTETAYQILNHWKEISQGEENQSAMLNILCDKLVYVWNDGGKEALENIYEKHCEKLTQ